MTPMSALGRAYDELYQNARNMIRHANCNTIQHEDFIRIQSEGRNWIRYTDKLLCMNCDTHRAGWCSLQRWWWCACVYFCHIVLLQTRHSVLHICISIYLASSPGCCRPNIIPDPADQVRPSHSHHCLHPSWEAAG